MEENHFERMSKIRYQTLQYIKCRCREVYILHGMSQTGKRKIDRLRDKYLLSVEGAYNTYICNFNKIQKKKYREISESKSKRNMGKIKGLFSDRKWKEADAHFCFDMRIIDSKYEPEFKKCEIRFKENLKKQEKALKRELKDIRSEFDIDYIRKIQEAKKKKSIRMAGIKGEQEVEYALKWLPDDYLVLGHQLKLLQGKSVGMENQEVDHIVIGPAGIVLVETKNYSGRIIIDEAGNWSREKDNQRIEGMRNPVQQCDRHHAVVKAITNIDDIYDVICIAHENAIIEGSKNSPIPVVKSDLLVRHIQSLKSKHVYTKDEMMKLKELIEQNIV